MHPSHSSLQSTINNTTSFISCLGVSRVAFNSYYYSIQPPEYGDCLFSGTSGLFLGNALCMHNKSHAYSDVLNQIDSYSCFECFLILLFLLLTSIFRVSSVDGPIMFKIGMKFFFRSYNSNQAVECFCQRTRINSMIHLIENYINNIIYISGTKESCDFWANMVAHFGHNVAEWWFGHVYRVKAIAAQLRCSTFVGLEQNAPINFGLSMLIVNDECSRYSSTQIWIGNKELREYIRIRCL